MPGTLAQKVRAKHPGAYDDMSDAQLEQSVRAKFPGVYDDIPRTSADTRSFASKAADSVVDFGIGAAKGAVNTISGLGQMARKIPGVNQLDRLVAPVEVNTTPSNTAQKVGAGVEQIGEFFVPVAGLAGKAAKAANVVKAGVLTSAQGGSPLASGVSAGITAVLPGGGAVRKAASTLQGSAEKTMAQALGATKEVMKAEASKLAPQMLARGVSGTRASMLAQARSAAATTGAQLDEAYKAAAAEGVTVPGAAIRDQLTQAARAMMVTDAAGGVRVIPGTERVVKRLSNLEQFVAKLGDDIPVDKAAAIKRTWDHIASKAGLFGPKAAASATDSADAWAIREASGAFRELINKNPAIADLNQEVAFWAGLKKVLAETERRTQAQSGGLVSGIAGAAGAGSGFASGQTTSDRVQNAILGGLAGRQLVRGMQSPWWRTTAASPAKKALADALASGSGGKLIGAISKITSALPSQVSQGLAR